MIKDTFGKEEYDIFVFKVPLSTMKIKIFSHRFPIMCFVQVDNLKTSLLEKLEDCLLKLEDEFKDVRDAIISILCFPYHYFFFFFLRLHRSTMQALVEEAMQEMDWQ
jgi:hypothetical protein